MTKSCFLQNSNRHSTLTYMRGLESNMLAGGKENAIFGTDMTVRISEYLSCLCFWKLPVFYICLSLSMKRTLKANVILVLGLLESYFSKAIATGVTPEQNLDKSK